MRMTTARKVRGVQQKNKIDSVTDANCKKSFQVQSGLSASSLLRGFSPEFAAACGFDLPTGPNAPVFAQPVTSLFFQQAVARHYSTTLHASLRSFAASLVLSSRWGLKSTSLLISFGKVSALRRRIARLQSKATGLVGRKPQTVAQTELNCFQYGKGSKGEIGTARARVRGYEF